MMKRILILILALAVGLSADAQNRKDVERLQAMLEGNRVTFEYTVSSLDAVPVVVKGNAVVDGDCYLLAGGGTDVYSDGTDKWTVDNEACEVYIERSVGSREFVVDPIGYLQCISNLKVGDTVVSGTFRHEDSGVAFDFKLTGIKTAPLSGSTRGFVFDTSDLPEGWIVNDLRY